jgi:hypothetical protein
VNGMSLITVENGVNPLQQKKRKIFPKCQHPKKRERQIFKIEIKLPTEKMFGSRIKKLSSVHPKAKRNLAN